MTMEQIILLAREAGFSVSWPETVVNFERFAALVAAAEREACAAEIAAEPSARQQEWWNDRLAALEAAVQDEREACAKLAERGISDFFLGKKVANAIRARGEE